MSAARHQRIRELFEAALDRPPAERPAWLAEASGGDAALAREVESLLQAHEDQPGFLESAAEAARVNRPVSWVGRRVGAWELLRELGRGGMGSVYVARRADEAFHRRVAVKLIRPGMDTEAVLERFRAERRILAALDHPHIARLLDGGSTGEGDPFLVMEYVEGQAIDRYCESAGLGVAERVRLFRTVCGAVSHAHRNLVVHRDLKPANILVSADGSPKLLDFGIAKLLNPDLAAAPGAPTVAALRLMTPEYASPEQARGEPVTTASDVYSLGVILYELLAGRRPYELQGLSPGEMERAICESEPSPPSAARGDTRPADAGSGGPAGARERLGGDLDNIVLMALRKEPHRRYASVDQFSEDLRRYLDHEPVLARRATWGYVVGKFARRNRGAVLAAGLAATALVAGLVGTTWQGRAAARERAKAERLLADVRGLTGSLIFEFHDAIEKLPGATPARELVVRRALEYLDRLARDDPRDPALQLELASAYGRLGSIQWTRYYANLGDLAGAEESQRKALAIREAVVAAHPGRRDARRDLGFSYVNVGDALAGLGRLTEALARYRQALEVREALAEGPDATRADRFNLAVSHQRLGDLLGNPGMENLGDLEGAMRHFGRMQEGFERLAADPEATADDRHSVGIGFEKLGRVAAARGELEAALAFYRRELEAFRASHAADTANVRYRRDLAVGYGNVGDALADLGRYPEAVRNYEAGLRIREALAAADPRNMGAARDLAMMERAIGAALARQGRRAEALARLDAAIRGLDRVAAVDPLNRWLRSQLVATRNLGATVALEAGHAAAARGYAAAALEALRRAAAEPDATAGDLNDLAWALLTSPVRSLRDPPRARAIAERAVQLSGGREPGFLDTLAHAYHRSGDRDRAVEAAERALALVPPGGRGRAGLEATLAAVRGGPPA
jgi:eukaryotic-like serine/threonine-protein kinase